MKTVSDPLPTLRALADGSRLRLLRLLDREELSVGELAESTGLRQSSVSRHLASLRAAGLVEERSEGVRTYLRRAEQAPAGMEALFEALLDLVRDPGFGHTEDLDGLARVLGSRTASREELFDRLAGDWDELRSQLLGGRLSPPEVAALLAPAGMRVIDAGTGTGIYLGWLSAVAGPTGEVVAVERSQAMLARAKQRAQALDNVTVRRGRIEELPVEDGWADAIVLSLALGHTEDPVAALRECVRVVRPGGRVVVADVEAHGDRTLIDRLGHGFTGFAGDALVRFLTEAGLVDARVVDLPDFNHRSNGARSGNGQGGSRTNIQPLRPLFAVGVRP